MANEPSTRLEASERRAQLLVAARATFGERGFSATSMNDIAESAGITKPVLYQHFDSKHDLFLELLQTTAEQLVELIQSEVNSGETGREKVERGIRAYVDFFAETPHNFRVLYGEGVRSDEVFSRELHSLDESFHEFTATHIEIADLDRPRRLVAAQAIAGMLESAVGEWIGSEQELDAGELTAMLSSFAWRGLRGGSPQ